jgi:single-stranded DNA-specific DHH superfamily exonuclease
LGKDDEIASAAARSVTTKESGKKCGVIEYPVDARVKFSHRTTRKPPGAGTERPDFRLPREQHDGGKKTDRQDRA